MTGLVQWYDLCEKTPSTKKQTVLCFGELADAFRILHWNSRDWTEDTVISVIDELMCKWVPESDLPFNGVLSVSGAQATDYDQESQVCFA